MAFVRRRQIADGTFSFNTHSNSSSNAVFPRFFYGSGFCSFTPKLFFSGITKFKIQNSKFRRKFTNYHYLPFAKGILLGCFGGLIGFFSSGFVQYNFGDAEVAMVFFFLMGLAVRLTQQNE